MDYSRHYQHLIAKHGYATKPDDGNYYERHHIMPKALGGSNAGNNLVYLTGKAHYVAHYLLYKVHGVGPMSSAFWMMSCAGESGERYVPNGRSFEAARKVWSASMSGPNNPNFGRVFTKEHRERLAASNRGRVNTHESNVKRSSAMSGELHHNAKRADVYCYDTDKILAEGIVLTVWSKANGYDQGALSRTVTGRCKHHKRVYARYV